jgi:sorting nexin-9/18/33
MTTSRTAEPSSNPLLGVDFDAGINTSAVWTDHVASASEQRGHVQEASFSDEEPESEIASSPSTTTAAPSLDEAEKQDKQERLPARTLYDFDGKPEFGELTVQAGLDLFVLKSDVGDGWSLVDCAGRVGLVPTSYYAVCK